MFSIGHCRKRRLLETGSQLNACVISQFTLNVILSTKFSPYPPEVCHEFAGYSLKQKVKELPGSDMEGNSHGLTLVPS
jgi:hypothetical protein